MPLLHAARHRRPARPAVRALRGATTVLALATVGTALTGLPAQADVTRCVGAVGTPGAFACYTSPRFDHAGADQRSVADVPAVCYGLGCTREQLEVPLPSDTVGGRFTAVSYLGHSYTVFRPAAGQPYVLTSTNPRFGALTTAQVLALEAALTAAQA
jgi:hypothetical protein